MLGYITAILLTLTSCTNRDTTVDKNKLLGNDYRLFQNTPAWDLAKAVKDEDIDKIKEDVGKNKSLLSFREPRFGHPLLQMAVMNENFRSVQILSELGADPNIEDTYDGSSSLIEAVKIGSIGGIHGKADSRYLELLLKHGGNPNAEEREKNVLGEDKGSTTALLLACESGIFGYVKMLVDAGANINQVNKLAQSPLYYALLSQNPDIVNYLIEKGVNYKSPLDQSADGSYKFYITNGLRDWTFKIGSEEYKKKMQLVDFLTKNGMDYWKTPVPKQLLDLYPKEYLDKY